MLFRSLWLETNALVEICKILRAQGQIDGLAEIGIRARVGPWAWDLVPHYEAPVNLAPLVVELTKVRDVLDRRTIAT